MFVDTGLLKMLNAQLTYLGSCYWKLFPANTTILETTVLSDLGSEASWTGYAAQNAGTWSVPVTITPRASTTNTTMPSFNNTSGSAQSFYVIALVDGPQTTLIWAQNLGNTTIPDGQSFTAAPSCTDKQE